MCLIMTLTVAVNLAVYQAFHVLVSVASVAVRGCNLITGSYSESHEFELILLLFT